MANIRPMTRRDLTAQAGNPSHELQKNYPELMNIKDVNELVNRAIGVVKPFVGHGFSELNFHRFLEEINKAKERGLEKVQFYITNFILAGAGMRVGEAIESIASMTTEDINDKIVLTEEQEELKKLVEKYRYNVIMCEASFQAVCPRCGKYTHIVDDEGDWCGEIEGKGGVIRITGGTCSICGEHVQYKEPIELVGM